MLQESRMSSVQPRISSDAVRPAIRSLRDMTVFSGVRISWLMLARKAVFASLAERASFRACSSSVWFLRMSRSCRNIVVARMMETTGSAMRISITRLPSFSSTLMDSG